MSSKALRSLMKERQLAKRIQHQYAKYDTLGKLTCTLCNGLVVKTEALWPSHLTSKQHRLSIQKLKTENHTSGLGAKRKSGVNSHDDDHDERPDSGKKTRLESRADDDNMDQEDGEGTESMRVEEEPNSNLPADFFDDPSQRPAPRPQSPDLMNDETTVEEDPEWAAFEASLANPDTEKEDRSALFAKASIFVEPVTYDESGDAPDPAMQVDPTEVDGEIEVEEEEDPIERKIREEKEEIMERIQNEEREQLEADDRVLRMKARVMAFRESRKAKHKKPT